MKLIVELNLGWKKLLVSPKDFITLSEILDRSEIVDYGYTDNSGSVLIKAERRMLTAEQARLEPISQDDYDALRAAEQAAKAKSEEAEAA